MESAAVSQLCLLLEKRTAIRVKITRTNNKMYNQKASQEPVRSNGHVLKPSLKMVVQSNIQNQTQDSCAEESLK